MAKLVVLLAICGSIGYFVNPIYGILLFLGTLIGVGVLGVVK
jgi:hypothetical protein